MNEMDEPGPAEPSESHRRNTLSPSAVAVWIALPLLLAALLGLIRQTAGNDWPVDRAIAQWVLTFESPAVDSIMLALTYLGVPLFVFAVAAGLTVVLVWQKRPGDALYVIAGVGIAILVSQVVKLGYGLPRPIYREPLLIERTFSYTSGHASASLALVIAALVVLRGTRWQWPVLIAGAFYVLVIAFSRIYLGVHFPSDIVGGWLVTIAVMALATPLRWLPAKRVRQEEQDSQ